MADDMAARQQLATLINALSLPPRMHYTTDTSHRPTLISNAQHTVRPTRVKENPHLVEQRLQPLLAQFATSLHIHPAAADIIRPVIDSTNREMSRWRVRKLRDETGLQSIIYLSLLHVVNTMLSESHVGARYGNINYPFPAGGLGHVVHDIFWRPINSGGARPITDYELVVMHGPPGGPSSELAIGAFEIKTTLSMSQTVKDQVSSYLAGGVVVSRSFERIALPEVVLVIDSTSNAAEKIIEQTTGQCQNYGGKMSLLSNYEHFLLWATDPNDPERIDTSQSISHTAVTVDKLWHSPLGLILGSTLLAMEANGLGNLLRIPRHPLGPPPPGPAQPPRPPGPSPPGSPDPPRPGPSRHERADQPRRSQRNHAGSSRTSSETIRPGSSTRVSDGESVNHSSRRGHDRPELAEQSALRGPLFSILERPEIVHTHRDPIDTGLEVSFGSSPASSVSSMIADTSACHFGQAVSCSEIRNDFGSAQTEHSMGSISHGSPLPGDKDGMLRRPSKVLKLQSGTGDCAPTATRAARQSRNVSASQALDVVGGGDSTAKSDHLAISSPIQSSNPAVVKIRLQNDTTALPDFNLSASRLARTELHVINDPPAYELAADKAANDGQPFGNGLDTASLVAHQLTLASFAGRGLVWSAYRAIASSSSDISPRSSPDSSPSLISRRLAPGSGHAACPSRQMLETGSDSGFSNSTTASADGDALIVRLCDVNGLCHDPFLVAQAQQDILNEWKMFDGPLRALQGSVVPVWHAMAVDFGSKDVVNESSGFHSTVWCAITDDVGSDLPVYLRCLPMVQDRILSLYSTLHSAGVLHGDVAWKHILSRGDWLSDLKLIDFGRAKTRQSVSSDEEWDWCIGKEIDNVRSLFRAVEVGTE